MGAAHFLTRTIERVGTKMSLYRLACNMKRMIKILGIGPLLAAIRAYGAALTAFWTIVVTSIRQSWQFFAAMIVIHLRYLYGVRQFKISSQSSSARLKAHFSTVWTCFRHSLPVLSSRE